MHDILLVARKAGKGALTASETAASNALVLPPGMYDLEVIVPIAPTGTSPTLTVAVQDSADGATFAALNDPRTVTLNGAATTAQNVFIRGVRVVRWANGLANVGVVPTVGGTTPSFGAAEFVFHPPGWTRAFNGTP